ncbi:MAG TPA: hypothetical protein GX002_03730 [Clostridiales bacterium]|nr:hypothetical protein [Clostridiales bacterium]
MKHYMVSDGMNISEAVTTIINEVETNGSRYWFIAENEDMLFVRDKSFSDLFRLIPLSDFIKQCREDDMIVSHSSFTSGNNQYTIGICAKETYIKEKGRLYQHNVYIVIPIVIISALIIVILVISILLTSKKNDRIRELEQELIDRNNTIEKLTVSIKKQRLQNASNYYGEETLNNIIYSKDVLNSLLDKINKENIVPLTIIVVEITAVNKSKSKNKNKIMASVSDYINREHVVAKIEEGIYAILLFHTKSEDIFELKDKLVNQWAVPLKRKGYIIRMGLSCIDNYDADVEKVFDLICKEVAKGIS